MQIRPLILTTLWIQTIPGIVADARDAPVITSYGGGDTATVNAAENQTSAATVTATDADQGDTLIFSLSGGADQALFEINAVTGVLTFKVAPDFEAPSDRRDSGEGAETGNPVQFEISVATANSQWTGTGSPVLISFFVNGVWTKEETFFEQINNGATTSKSFTLTSSPSRVKFIATSNDAWGYWKILLGKEIVLLDPNGEAGTDYGDNPYWLDGDEEAPAQQEYDLQVDWFEVPEGEGQGEVPEGEGEGDNNYEVQVTVSDGALTDVQALTVTVTDDASDNDPLTQGLVAYYPFNGNANDESGNGNDGTVNGATLAVDRHGKVDKAYTFDGVNDFIQVNDHPSLKPTTSISVSVWINYIFRSENGLHRVISKNSSHWSKGPGAYQIIAGGDNYGEFGFYITTTEGTAWFATSSKIDASDTSLLPSEWYQVTATWVGGTAKVYHDGVLVYQGTRGGTISHTRDPLFFGKDQNQDAYFKGSIDDVRIYDRALSAEEVTALYDLEKPADPDGEEEEWEDLLEGEGESRRGIVADTRGSDKPKEEEEVDGPTKPDGEEEESEDLLEGEGESPRGIVADTRDSDKPKEEEEVTADGLHLILEGGTVDENAPAGTRVGRLVMKGDVDTGLEKGTTTFELVEGNGDEGNDLFMLEEDELYALHELDYEESPEWSIRVRASLADGTVGEQNFTILVRNMFVPLVETFEQVRDNDPGGLVIADGAGRILSVGVRISESPLLTGKGVPFIEAKSFSRGGEFHVQAHDLDPGQTYYYQAFATNAEGMGLGVLKKFVAALPQPSGVWADAIPVGDAGWYHSSVGLVYLLRGYKWAYHERLGWIYVQGSSPDDLWIWMDGSGWYWTARKYYPYLYRTSLPGWVYILQSVDGVPVFYNTVTGEVEFGGGDGGGGQLTNGQLEVQNTEAN